MPERRVVITGLGVVSSIGTGRQEFWQGLCERRVGLSPIDEFDVSAFGCQIGGQIRDFKINKYIPRSYRKAAKLMARDIELAVAGADLAVRDAGLVTKGIDEDNPQVDPVRLGTNMGAGLIDIDLDEMGMAVQEALDGDRQFSYKLWGRRGMAQLTPLWLLKFLPNMLACHVGIIHDAQGPSNSVMCGEISSQQAVAEGFHTVGDGKVDICISGGARNRIARLTILRLELLGRLNTQSNDNPTAACLPFDSRRAGTVPGDGAGIFILEDLGHAQERGAKIYAELGSVVATREGGDSHQIPPSPEGLSRAIREALGLAGFGAEDVDLVIPHGVGGVAEDAAEARGILMGLGEEKGRSVPVLPLQGALGNSGAASGAMNLTAAVLAISEGKIPGAVNDFEPCEQCPLNIVGNGGVEVGPEVVLLTGYTVGGQSAALVVKRFAD